MPDLLKQAAGFVCSIHVGLHESCVGFMAGPGVVVTCAHKISKYQAKYANFMFTMPGVASPFHDPQDDSRSRLVYPTRDDTSSPDVAIVLGSTLPQLYQLICKHTQCQHNPAMLTRPTNQNKVSELEARRMFAVVHNTAPDRSSSDNQADETAGKDAVFCADDLIQVLQVLQVLQMLRVLHFRTSF